MKRLDRAAMCALAMMLWGLSAAPGEAQTASDRLKATEPYFAGNLAAKMPNIYFSPNWIGDRDSFWYANSDGGKTKYLIVDAATSKKTAAFDQEKMAAALGRVLGNPVSADDLPIASLDFRADMSAVTVGAEGKSLLCDLPVTECSLIPEAAPVSVRTSLSPDGKRLVYLKDNNLWLRDLKTKRERQLTHDGIADFSYGDMDPYGDFMKVVRRHYNLPHPLDTVVWSPDGRYILALRQDMRPYSSKLLLTEYLPPDGSYDVPYFARAATANDPARPQSKLTLIDVVSGVSRPMNIDPQALNDWALPYFSGGLVWWIKGKDEAYFISASRGGQHYWLTRLDLKTGLAHNVIEEDAKFYVRLSPMDYTYPGVHVMPDGNEAIWYSERDGWGHLYLYDLHTGKVKRQITHGQWVVDNILRVDDATRTIYFTGTGREPGRNVYYRHLYRVSMDGGEPELLTPEDADHDFNRLYGMVKYLNAPAGSSISPSGKYFVDTYSTLDQPPITIIRDRDGHFMGKVFQVDTSELGKLGIAPPERVIVKADDGKTDLYGVIYKPLHMEAGTKYPIVDLTYPGPQEHSAPVSFRDAFLSASFNGYAMSQLGFVVVALDGRGTGFRSREFRDAFMRTDDPLGAADQVAAIRNMAATRPYMDLDRVGVTGGSFGGYGSLRDALLYPKFFKVCVSDVGPQDFRYLLQSVTAERFFGVPAESKAASDYYDRISNVRDIGKLDSKLLLIYGALDENVPVKHAMEIFGALIKADKPFDSFMIPELSHDAGQNRYTSERLMLYFLDNLGGPMPLH